MRQLEGQKLLVVMNFSNDVVKWQLPEDQAAFKGSKLLISNVPNVAATLEEIELQPWEGRVYFK